MQMTSRASRRALLEGRALACERVEQLDQAIAAGEELLERLATTSDTGELAHWKSGSVASTAWPAGATRRGAVARTR